jgi:hypothetical protein
LQQLLQVLYLLISMVDFDLGSRGTKLKAEQERRLREARKKLEQERRAKAAADAHAAEVQAQLKQKRLEQLRKEEEVPLIAILRYTCIKMFYTKSYGLITQYCNHCFVARTGATTSAGAGATHSWHFILRNSAGSAF